MAIVTAGLFGAPVSAIETKSSADSVVFEDVSETDYHFNSVKWALKNEITGGVTETEFLPATACTRGQVVTFLWRASGQPEPASVNNPFHDVTEKNYFYQAVLWAVEKGITSGVSDEYFAPYQTCTRAQTITFLWRAQGMPEADTRSTWSNSYQAAKVTVY